MKGRGIRLASGAFAIVDASKHKRLARFRWHLFKSKNMRGGGYPVRTYRTSVGGKPNWVFMHHSVVGYPPVGMVVDHVNGNTLDNRKSNLRFATREQNCWNARRTPSVSGYIGVTAKRDKPGGKLRYQARISHHDRNCSLGYYDTAVAAARAYDRRALELRGDFAFINFRD